MGSERVVIKRAGTALALSGLLDHDQGMELVNEVERALHGSVGRVVLDLRRVTVVDSRGLLALIASARNVQQAGRCFVLRRPSTTVRRFLDTTDTARSFAME
ncbi:MAG: STAS domain-containing protein [Actinobacteria bacterium]|nr:STAS domain-containing protein [Actinomycetota bacterium]